MSKRKIFEDGSSIEWVDKETLKYVEGDFSALVWVDFEEGFFATGRIIRSSSITRWASMPNGSSEFIPESKRQDIIEKVMQYYKSLRRACRIVP